MTTSSFLGSYTDAGEISFADDECFCFYKCARSVADVGADLWWPWVQCADNKGLGFCVVDVAERHALLIRIVRVRRTCFGEDCTILSRVKDSAAEDGW